MARRARSVIASDLDLATSVNELGDRLASAGDAVGREPAALLHELRRHPGLFRVVDPWRGPWRCATATVGTVRGARGSDRAHAQADAPVDPVSDGAMVVPVEVGWAEGATRLSRRLRESIYRLGRSVDADSPLALARWTRLMRAGAAAERRMGADPDSRTAGPGDGVTRS